MNFKKTPELLTITATVVATCAAFSVDAISATAATPSPAEQRTPGAGIHPETMPPTAAGLASQRSQAGH